jgi:predicted permease
VSYTAVLPLSMSTSRSNIEPDGAGGTTADRSSRVEISFQNVDAGYFDVVRLPIVLGRAFATADDDRAGKVAVINETLARRLWPNGSALGRTFGHNGDRVTVVGVARDSKYESLSERTPGFVYFPTAQTWQSEQAQTLMVRSTLDPASLPPAIRDAVHTVDAALPRPLVRTLIQDVSIVLFPQRIAAMVTGVLGAVGLLLAAIGLYGVIAYSVGRRTREIGVRVALGAQRGDVLGMVVGEGMRLAVTGVVIGVILAAGATQLIAAFLFNVSPMDAITFTVMAALFIVVALVASYLPARRAAATDPLTALRSD